MTDYNDGKWHGWNGGECPVHSESVVDIAHTVRGVVSGETAEQWFWEGEKCCIIAFRVVKPYVEPPKPREFWINDYGNGEIRAHETKEKADMGASHRRIRCIRVREVLE